MLTACATPSEMCRQEALTLSQSTLGQRSHRKTEQGLLAK